MSAKIMRLVAAGLLAAPMMASATPVSFSLQGTFDSDPTGSEVVASGLNLRQGDSFSLVITFDTATPISNPGACGSGGPGATCRFNGASAANQFFSTLTVNGTLIPGFRSPPLSGPAYFNSLIVRNDAQVGGTGDYFDGYTWGTEAGCGLFGGSPMPACTPGQDHDFVNAIFRGPVTDLVTDARVLPTSLPPGLYSLMTRSFQLCSGVVTQVTDAQEQVRLDNNCEYASLQGTFAETANVPEPGTLALFGLGLAGLVVGRRRRNA